MDETGFGEENELGEGADIRLDHGERILTPDEVAAVHERQLGRLDGVTITQLWSDERSHAGVLRLGPGATIPEHTHDEHAHHIWVAEGRVQVRGRELEAGAYAYVPPGLAHDLHGVGPTGCKVFYTYLTD
jgi:quercetin dioxygenase-like cupin family protein